MKTMIAIYKDMNQTNYKIVLNEAKLINTDYSYADIEAMLETKIDYVIPKSFYNKKIEKYVYNGKIMTLDSGILNTKGGSIIYNLKMKYHMLKMLYLFLNIYNMLVM